MQNTSLGLSIFLNMARKELTLKHSLTTLKSQLSVCLPKVFFELEIF